MYAFRFGTSDKLVHLNQQQLDRIPYLSKLVARKDDFKSMQNKNGEYVLNYPIEYTSFIPILRSIVPKQSYILINEISEDDNVLDTLQLFDYLGINSFRLPLLKYEDLVLSNPINIDNNKRRVKYREAIISEARQTAAEFIIALSKNEYNLCDSHTVEQVFSLIKVILSNPSVFSSRFRHHTLTAAKECCYYLFSKKQQRLLPTTHQIAQHSKNDSFIYLYDDDKPVPDNFRNTFGWKGVYTLMKENRTDRISFISKVTYDSKNSFYKPWRWWSFLRMKEFSHIKFCDESRRFHIYDDVHDKQLPVYATQQNRKNKATQSVPSRCFNTLPKRSNFDNFKHRFGSKSQKYR